MKCLQGFNIKGFQEISLLDWDGKITSIIFLGGCNLRCGFCHSSNLVVSEETIENIAFERIADFLNGKRNWVDGVVITGGEPTIDEERLLSLILAIKNLGFLIKLDTNGTRPRILQRLFESKALDYVAMDIKAPLREQDYRMACQADVEIEDIITSKDMIINSGIDYEFRTTVVPGVISMAAVVEIAKSLAPAKRYRLQQFVARDTLDAGFLELKPYPIEDLIKMASVCSEFLPDVSVRRNS